jgi:MFS family permease
MSSPSATLPRLAWITVALLWVVGLLNYLDRLVITTMHDPIVAAVPMTEARFGLLTSIFLWVYAVFSPACGFLGDRVSRKWVLLASLVVWSSVTLATGHARTFTQLFWLRALMGISEACYLPTALALIADYHRGPTRSFAMALHGTGIYTGAALGGVGGYLAATVGWRTGFMLLGVIGVAYALILMVCLKDARPAESQDPVTTRETLRPAKIARELFSSKSFWVLLGINALIGIADWTIYGWLPVFLHERFSLAPGQAGLTATSVLQVTSFAGILIGGLWSDRWSRTSPRARMLVPTVGYLIGAPGLLLLALHPVLLPALAGLTCYGLARGFFDANRMPIIRQLVNERYSATAFGVTNFVSCVTGGLMTFAGGSLRDAHLSLSIAYLVCAGAILLTAGLCFLLKPQAR